MRRRILILTAFLFLSALSAQAAGRAKHIFPVKLVAQGKMSYIASHHDYPATDIFCPVGSQFLAVTDGVVDFVSLQEKWDPKIDEPSGRGGLSVAIIGDDGVRYYGSHLSKVAPGIMPGVRVKMGQVLGLTGDSGNAKPQGPQLHFGISHPTTSDDWKTRRGELPPYPFLKAWQKGRDKQPKI